MKRFLILTMALMLCLISIVPVSYASEIPSDYMTQVESYAGDNYYGYMLYSRGDRTYLTVFRDTHAYHTKKNAEFELIKKGTNINIYLKDTTGEQLLFSAKDYYYNDTTGQWATNSTTTDQYNHFALHNETQGSVMYESMYTIYNEDGTIFFQQPPAELYQIIQEVTKGEMSVTEKIIQGQMKTIVLCGIGCLALLISLVLLVRTLRRYLQG